MQIPLRCATGLLLLAIGVLSGCVWMRLLDLKGQLADFDRYIEVPPGAGLELRFRQPVLLEEDVDYLLKAKPTAEAENAGIKVRVYVFHHVPVKQVADPPTAITTLLLSVGIRDGKVIFVTLPEPVFQVIPRDLALRGMRAIGRAEVDRDNRSAAAAIQLADLRSPLPTRDALIALFGHPNQRSFIAGTEAVNKAFAGQERLLWRFQLRGETLRSDGKPVIAAIAFTYKPNQDRPTRFQANISGMWLYLDLPPEAPLGATPTMHP